MVSPDRPRLTDVSITLRELAWTIHRKAPERAGVGPLPTTEIALLKQVIDAPASTVGELAEALGLQQPNVSTALRTLEERGFVSREKSARDRRVSLIQPTPSGVQEHRAVAAEWSRPVNEALESLTAEQLATLEDAVEALTAVHQALRKASGRGSASDVGDA
ncbi:MarR family winged helix-turn-helix transcriptional regulator [Microterricola viridarii]|uniref:MarR family transcriptional regulator n=1 Tax=Microterricola viridarii TaxID=412690 RepID=A0A0X8E3U1_9MICO|nr:MarR family transcriptional regulator [Microterricola viridarii]AMB59543.1 MarR family transcriptional regulator [Microterricola viridarii]